MTNIIPFQLGSKPGIKRDGTVFEGDHYVDAQWCRFQRGLPRKMLGYRRLSQGFTDKVYGMNVFEQSNTVYVHGGESASLERITFDTNGVPTGVIDRTPAGLVSSSNNIWQFGQMYNTAGSNTVLIAHAGQNLNDIVNSTETPIFYGSITGTGALATLSGTDVPAGTAGGIVVSGPYLFVYGNSGYITWSSPTQPTDFSTANGGGGPAGARVTAQKILKGLTLRAGVGAAPAALFWATNSLIRASFQGGSTVFQFDTISDEITVMSSSAPIEYDGVYYWPGIDRFYMYTGVMSEIDNPLNNDWFFNNINKAQRQKVFAFKVPRFGEIWWCFPYGDATECTHAVIYNVRESRRLGFPVWYDTRLPANFRTSAAFAQLLGTPILSDGTEDPDTNTFGMWQHETGVDEVADSTNAIQSYFETSDISLMLPPGGGKPANNATQVSMVEVDLIQRGEMNFRLSGRRNPRAPVIDTPVLSFSSTDPLLYPKQELRILRMKFESNVAGGYYEMGQVLLHIGAGTGTTTA